MKLSPQDFIHSYYPAAQANERKYGVPALVTLAQAAVESGWGAHAPHYNFFGIKAYGNWKGKVQTLTTQEYVNGQWITIQDKFRAYDSPKQAFEDHARFLRENSRYANAFRYKDPYRFAQEVARAGYATAPEYYSILAGLISQMGNLAAGMKFNSTSKWLLWVGLGLLGAGVGYAAYIYKKHY